MNGRLRTDIVKQRSRILTEFCNSITLKNNLKYIGETYDVLVTETGKNNTYLARNENYKPVVIKEKTCLGNFVRIEILDASPTYLVGMLI